MRFTIKPLLFVLLAAGVEPGGAEPPSAPSRPVTIDSANAAAGRYLFRVDRRPDDGRLAVPTGFPQIVRATLAAGQDRDLAVELNADATKIDILLPAASGTGGPTAVAVETADASGQFADGRIVLTAVDARVNGQKAKLEQHPGNARIGFWTNPSDSVAWTRAATRWGMYDVRLTYSTASPGGTEIEVDVAGTTLSGTLAPTGSWYRYATMPLGKVYVAKAGDFAVAVRCTKLVGGAVMNLKAVTLSPACEGAPPVQADDGSVTLHGRDATVLGTVLRWEPAEKKQTLGFWTRPTDAAMWTFAIEEPGTFDVEVLQGCGTGQGGSTMAIEIDRSRPEPAAPIEFTVEDTGGFQQFRPRIVGRVRLTETGQHDLRIAPRSIAKAAACDIRQIRLVPVNP